MANLPRLDSTQLANILQRFPAYSSIKTWVLAYSGGVDSRVLLHLMSQLSIPLRAIYIDHGLQAASLQWADFCRQTCADLNVSFECIQVNARACSGESPEAAARDARYKALEKLIGPHECLLTAQHRDDQAETFLLQLLRGAGAAGLSAMPMHQRFHQGWHLRPLLEFSRQEILRCAQAHSLQWVEDPSNQDTRFDRNYLRHEVMPVLSRRWPALIHTLSISALQQAENQQLLDALAAQDLGEENRDGKLSVDTLLKLDEPRQRNALRYWISNQYIRMPSRSVMQQIITQMLHARHDAAPSVHWDDVEMHRYKNELYLLEQSAHDPRQVFTWNGVNTLYLSALRKHLSWQKHDGGLREDLLGQVMQVKFRQGGECIQPAGRQHTHELKKLLQESDVPPWERDRIPLIYFRNELIAVCGYWLAENYVNKTGMGWMPVLTQ